MLVTIKGTKVVQKKKHMIRVVSKQASRAVSAWPILQGVPGGRGGGPPRRNRPRPPLPTQHNSNRIRTPWALSSFRTATPVSTRRPFPPTLMTRGPTLPYPTPLHRKNPRKRIGGALIATCPFPPSFPSFLLSRRNAPP
jgi:hypothetical protein